MSTDYDCVVKTIITRDKGKQRGDRQRDLGVTPKQLIQISGKSLLNVCEILEQAAYRKSQAKLVVLIQPTRFICVRDDDGQKQGWERNWGVLGQCL